MAFLRIWMGEMLVTISIYIAGHSAQRNAKASGCKGKAIFCKQCQFLHYKQAVFVAWATIWYTTIICEAQGQYGEISKVLNRPILCSESK